MWYLPCAMTVLQALAILEAAVLECKKPVAHLPRLPVKYFGLKKPIVNPLFSFFKRVLLGACFSHKSTNWRR